MKWNTDRVIGTLAKLAALIGLFMDLEWSECMLMFLLGFGFDISGRIESLAAQDLHR
jgi:hypothetical protein